MKAVILAGGAGTRLWPMSRTSRPKQFYDVVGETTMIEDTYRRLLRLFPKESIYFSVSPPFAQLLAETFPELSSEQMIIEPEKRDTGPAMGYAAAYLARIDPDEPMVFVPSDHYIRDEERFLRCLELGGSLVQETGLLVDIGIRPVFPSTALGYTKVGELIKEVDGIRVHAFLGHTEKPAYPIAKAYLEDGSFLWHANYYMWTPRLFLEAFLQYAPDIGRGLQNISAALQQGDRNTATALFCALPKVSIDYAVTEQLPQGHMLVIEGDFGWSDIGSWDTLHDQLSENQETISRGTVVTIDTSRSLIYGQKNKITAVLGMEGVVIVDTPDALLVCNRMDAQRVKELVQKIKDEGSEAFL